VRRCSAQATAREPRTGRAVTDQLTTPDPGRDPGLSDSRHPLSRYHAAAERSRRVPVPTIDLFVDRFRDAKVDAVVGIEARGYMIARRSHTSWAPASFRCAKPGKLPGEKFSEEYALEYAPTRSKIHADAVGHGHRVLVVGRICVATGGTCERTLRRSCSSGSGQTWSGVAVLIELEALAGRAALPGVRRHQHDPLLRACSRCVLAAPVQRLRPSK